jgi:nucleoside-diphosphate-sugar epimerase
VFVTGASGFLGRELVRNLAEHGVPVVGLARDEVKAEIVRARGGRAVVGDLVEGPSVERAAEGCRSIVHLASAANDPTATEPQQERVRVEGVRTLARIAQQVGATRLVVGSGYWVYRGGPGRLDESAATEPSGESRINFECERAAFAERTARSLDVVVARPAMVYGDGAWFRPTAEAIREGSYRTIDGGTNEWSFVSVTDTAEAFRVLLEKGASGEVYNVADDRPTRWGEFAAFVAAELKRPAPPSLTRAEAEKEYGPVIARHLLANRALTAAKLRALGWAPRFASYRDGIPPILAAMRPG